MIIFNLTFSFHCIVRYVHGIIYSKPVEFGINYFADLLFLIVFFAIIGCVKYYNHIVIFSNKLLESGEKVNFSDFMFRGTISFIKESGPVQTFLFLTRLYLGNNIL